MVGNKSSNQTKLDHSVGWAGFGPGLAKPDEKIPSPSPARLKSSKPEARPEARKKPEMRLNIYFIRNIGIVYYFNTQNIIILIENDTIHVFQAGTRLGSDLGF